jgi:hypothetical protein
MKSNVWFSVLLSMACFTVGCKSTSKSSESKNIVIGDDHESYFSYKADQGERLCLEVCRFGSDVSSVLNSTQLETLCEYVGTARFDEIDETKFSLPEQWRAFKKIVQKDGLISVEADVAALLVVNELNEQLNDDGKEFCEDDIQMADPSAADRSFDRRQPLIVNSTPYTIAVKIQFVSQTASGNLFTYEGWWYAGPNKSISPSKNGKWINGSVFHIDVVTQTGPRMTWRFRETVKPYSADKMGKLEIPVKIGNHDQ